MRQSRLEHYFPSDAPFIPSGYSFLDLPFSVRKLIYEYAELDGSLIDLNYTNLKVYPKGKYPETEGCRKLVAKGYYGLKKLNVPEQDEVWEFDDEPDNRIEFYGRSLWNRPYGSHQSLFLTCKQVHKEVEAFTYTRNVFRVCLGQPLGFTKLLRMSDNALYNLVSLTIRLDVPKTEVFDDGWVNKSSDWYMDWRPTPSTHLDLSNKWGKLVLKTWNSVLKRLTQLTRPGQLRLRVIFRAKTIADAKAIIEPMMPLLPRLRDCGISVERHGRNFWWKENSRPFNIQIREYEVLRPDPATFDREISQLVQEAIKRVSGEYTRADDQATKPFRYLDLPQEIRFEILEYTDLVSPHPVQWRPRDWIQKYSCCEYRYDNGYSMTNEDGDALCNCDRQPAPSVENKHYNPCCKCCSPEDSSNICYCSAARGTIWSTSCKCFPARSALFSVSSQVRQDAIAIYYACNQILVTPYNSPAIRNVVLDDYWYGWGAHAMPKIELSLYLSSIARNAFQHIRWLEWILPGLGRDYLLPKTKAWSDYLDTILLMEHAMTLSAVTFTINMVCTRKHQKRETWIWFETIILPVRRLGEAGLKDFFVYLPLGIEKGMREHHERDLERAVMGKGYNSAERGKPPERMSRVFNVIIPDYVYGM